MRPSTLFRPRLTVSASAVLAAALLAACNPTYNWRDWTSEQGRYKVLFPAKPASFTRPVEVDGLRLEMTMTAAEVDGATFAVGTASAPDAARARTLLPAMRQALLRNIGADSAVPPAVPPSAPAASASSASGADGRVDATGAANGKPMRLSGRFEARGARVYQVIVLGPPGAAPPEQVDQFLTSFTTF